MPPDTPHNRRPRGRPVGIRGEDALWRRYMYENEAELVRAAEELIGKAREKARSDMREPLRTLHIIRTRCNSRIDRERKRGEES